MSRARGGKRGWRVEAFLLLLLAALTAFTILIITSPRVLPAVINEQLDLVINTASLFVASAVAGLAWGRFREGGQWSSIFRSSAFLVLAALNLLVLVILLSGLVEEFGFAPTDPGPVPLLAAILARGTTAFLLVIGGIFAVRRASGRAPWAWLVLLLPTVAFIGLVGAGALAPEALPPLLDPQAVERLAENPTQQFTGLPPLGLLLANGLVALGFMVAAVLGYVAYRRSGSDWDAFLATGLLLAAFSAVHGAVHPGVYAGLVTTGDLLRLAFYAVLLAGVVAESREDVRAVRRANRDLRRLHDADVARATQEERARLAREIHDGLAQDLWYAKLKQDRLAKAKLPAEERTLAGQVADALDSALAEARQAIMALRPAEEAAFDVVLRRYVDDFSDRFGILTVCRVDGVPPNVSPRAQAELLRMVQEALNNVRKHADATLVRVEAQTDADGLRLLVADNGRGFDPHDRSSGYGLTSMRERAAIVGASVNVDSRPQDGTRVEIRLGP